jgi:hypothetical protein
MRKFKVGDRVKYIGSVYKYFQTGKVVGYLDDAEYPYCVSPDSGREKWPCEEAELELEESRHMANEPDPTKCWKTTCGTCKAVFRYHLVQISEAESSSWTMCPACKRYTQVPHLSEDRTPCT